MNMPTLVVLLVMFASTAVHTMEDASLPEPP